VETTPRTAATETAAVDIDDAALADEWQGKWDEY
jgi:hypothetical protein